MFRIESIIQLKEEENIEALVRRHLFTLIPALFFAMLLIVVPFFFLFPLMSWGIIGLAIFAGCIAIGVMLAIRALFLWNADVLVVTNLRLVDVDQKGLLSRRVSEVAYDAIQDVSWLRKGIWQTIFRMGSVSVQTAGQATNIEVTAVPYPDKLHDLINDVRSFSAKESKKTETDLPKDRRSRLRRIARLLEQVNDEMVADVEALLERESKKKSMEKLFETEEQDLDDEDEEIDDENNDEDDK
jgi:membrane protein YdbS with pleckstrin-like domain